VLVAVNRRIEIGKELEMELRQRAEQRRATTLRQNTVVKNFPQQEVTARKTRDLTAKAAGFGNGKTSRLLYCPAQLLPQQRIHRLFQLALLLPATAGVGVASRHYFTCGGSWPA